MLTKAKEGFFQRLKTQRERLGLHAPSNKHLRKMITPLHTVDKEFNLEISNALSPVTSSVGPRHQKHNITQLNKDDTPY